MANLLRFQIHNYLLIFFSYKFSSFQFNFAMTQEKIVFFSISINRPE